MLTFRILRKLILLPAKRWNFVSTKCFLVVCFILFFEKKNKRKRKLVFFSEKEKVFHQKEISPCYLYFVFDSFPLSFILPISFDLCVGIYCSLYWTFYFSDAILEMKIYIIWIIFKRIFQLLVGWLFVFVF